MSNLISADSGAKVIAATASDERHPASTIIDGSEKTFWYTTGMYPHEATIKLGDDTNPDGGTVEVVLKSRHVRVFTLLTSARGDAKVWDELFKSNEVEKSQYEMQTTTKQIRLPASVRHVKLRIDNGWEEFAAVHELRIEMPSSPES